jgi:hypothetical protein
MLVLAMRQLAIQSSKTAEHNTEPLLSGKAIQLQK